jgi:hypothetical protein
MKRWSRIKELEKGGWSYKNEEIVYSRSKARRKNGNHDCNAK